MLWADPAWEELPKRFCVTLVLTVTLAEQAQCSSQPCPSPLCLFLGSHPTALIHNFSCECPWWSSSSCLWGDTTPLSLCPAPDPLSNLWGQLPQKAARQAGVPTGSACSLPTHS